MPRLESMPSPHDPSQTIEAWAWARLTNLDHGAKTILVEWEYYLSHAAAYTPGATPIGLRRQQVYGPEPVEAVYGQRPQLTPYVPAVYSEPDPETGESEIVSEAVEPTFGEAPLLSPRVPSYDEALVPIFAGQIGLVERIDQLGVERFGGTAIPAGPPQQEE